MFILDTNTVEAVLHDNPPHLKRRIMSRPMDVYISVVGAHEMIKGVLSELKKYEHKPKVAQQYEFLRKLIINLNKFQILPYDDDAERVYRALSPAIKRTIGLEDSRIAASAISRRFTVITRNSDHFECAGAIHENWIAS